MNTMNTQPKAVKKLALNKETIRQLSSAQLKVGSFGPTADCSLAGTCNTCAC
jgi:hypothetical protein